MSFYSRCIDMIKDGEGSIPHMYLDTVSLVTVGVGNMLPDVSKAIELDFVRNDNGSVATDVEITADFEAVSAHPNNNYAASYYRQFTKLILPDAAIDALLQRRIDGFEAGLRRDFPDYDTYVDNAKLGLIDMAFNLGNHGLVTKFPTFTRAAREQDWTTCARECRRTGIGDHRNEETKHLFESI